MPAHLKLPQSLVRQAQAAAIREHRTTGQQIEYWARIGRIALENPEMPACLILDTLHALAEVNAGAMTPYKPS